MLKLANDFMIVKYMSTFIFRSLMHKKKFASDFTGFKKDGAQWLVDNTDIKLVGKILDFPCYQ